MSSLLKKVIVCCLVFVAAIGFAAGMNFSVNFDVYENAKRCFSFGVYEFFQGKDFYKIFFSSIISTIKFYIIHICGIFSWWTFPIMPINLFCISFKIGVTSSFVLNILGFSNMVESVYFVLIICIFLIYALLFSVSVLERKIYHLRIKKFDISDFEYLKKTLLCAFLFIAIINCLYTVSSGLGLKLFGFFNTFL